MDPTVCPTTTTTTTTTATLVHLMASSLLHWYSAIQSTSPTMNAIVAYACHIYYGAAIYTALFFTTIYKHCISLYGAVLYTVLDFTTLHCTIQCSALHFTCASFHCTSLHGAVHSTILNPVILSELYCTAHSSWWEGAYMHLHCFHDYILWQSDHVGLKDGCMM